MILKTTSNGIMIPDNGTTSSTDEIGDVVNAVVNHGNVLYNTIQNVSSLNSTVTNISTLMNGMVDTIIEEGQNIGGSLNGYIVTKKGFVFQWGRIAVPTGAGARVTFPKKQNITITVNTNCTTGLFITYTPKDMMDGTGFNIATNSSTVQEANWFSIGNM